MNIRHITALLVAAAATWLAACGGGGGGIGGTGSPTGTMRLSITDAPSCGYDSVNITIDRVRVHKSSSAVDADSGWSEVVLTPAKRVDLLTLTNGLLEPLGQTALPAGKYTQMRLVLAPNTGSNPFANSVVPTGSDETALTTPSGQQSGIKLNVNIDIVADTVADFVLDFDACKSVVKRGNSGQYNLKPVIAVIPVISAGVVGFVDPAIAATANVSLQSTGAPPLLPAVVKATLPDPATGRFVLFPVRVGTYDLVITANERATAVMTGVPVTASGLTNINGAALPIAPPLATLRDVDGTVTPPSATLRALQTLTGGPTVEVAWAPVDLGTGAFALKLPMQAPVKTGYPSLGFVPDTGATGKYTLEAASDGATKTQAIDTAAAVHLDPFTFP
jgi:Domain of unknown function (DUF4382)